MERRNDGNVGILRAGNKEKRKNDMWTMGVLAPLIIAGSLAGLLAGLLGLGGGILVVPILVFLLKHVAPHADIQHVAVGTSFAIMVFTSLSSAITHAKLKNVRWDIFKYMAVGIVAGVIVGSSVASLVPERNLRIFFIIFTFTMGILTFIKAFKNIDEKPEDKGPVKGKRHLAAGGIIGLISSWLGIGGGGMTVPYLLFNGVLPRQSVGTAAAVGWPVAVAGALSYLVIGLGKTGMGSISDGFFGFVFLPGLFVIGLCTVIFAPIGAKISTFIAPKALTITMALSFLAISANMLYSLYN